MAELTEVLDAEARKWRGRAMAFERMAKARKEPEPDWCERPAPARPADMPAASPSPEQTPAPEAPRPSVPLRTPEEQLAAFGLTPESAAAALAERRKRFGQ